MAKEWMLELRRMVEKCMLPIERVTAFEIG